MCTAADIREKCFLPCKYFVLWYVQACVQLVDIRELVLRTHRVPNVYMRVYSGGHTEFVALLLQREANANVRGLEGNTPLHHAALEVCVFWGWSRGGYTAHFQFLSGLGGAEV